MDINPSSPVTTNEQTALSKETRKIPKLSYTDKRFLGRYETCVLTEDGSVPRSEITGFKKERSWSMCGEEEMEKKLPRP